MGKTFRHQPGGHFEDDRRGGRKAKHPNHANGRKSGGMRIINALDEQDDGDYFDDDVEIHDNKKLNRYSEKSTL